jgi:hypothetical protein
VLSSGGALASQPNPNDPSWYRQDGTLKGMGFMGPLKFKDGRTSTELSIGVNLGGKQTEIPSLVPTLSQQEIDHLLSGGRPTPEIVNKAVEHALQRQRAGLPVFATPQDWPPQP